VRPEVSESQSEVMSKRISEGIGQGMSEGSHSWKARVTSLVDLVRLMNMES
jgi:hypothetical protein